MKTQSLLVGLFLAVTCIAAAGSAQASDTAKNSPSLQMQQPKIDPTVPQSAAGKSHATMLLDGGVSTAAEQIQWADWHEAFQKAVIENQAEMLKHAKSIRLGLAVVEYTVTRDKHLTVRALSHDDPVYKKLAQEALSNYHMEPIRKALFIQDNPKFDSLVCKCYERLNNKSILTFPANSERSEIKDTRWHIAGVGVGNYVHWRTDDYEQVGAPEEKH